MALHQAPTDGAAYPGFHFHIEFHPPLRKPNLLKYLAGPEIGGGNFLSDTSPEAKAGSSRRPVASHYRRTITTARRHDGTMTLLTDHPLLEPLQALHRRIRDEVVASTERAAVEALSHVHADDEGDTIYAIDKVAEDVLVEAIDRTIAREHGTRGAGRRRTARRPRRAAAWRVRRRRPLDDHRGPHRRHARPDVPEAPRLDPHRRRATARIQPDRSPPNPLNPRPVCPTSSSHFRPRFPLVKQHLCDELWAVAGQGAHGIRVNRLTGDRELTAAPPLAIDDAGARLCDRRALLSRDARGTGRARRRDRRHAAGPAGPREGAAVRGPVHLERRPTLRARHRPRSVHRRPASSHAHRHTHSEARQSSIVGTSAHQSLCCHPYDLCTELIARECGVVVTDERGAPLDAPLNVEADVSWVGYANAGLRATVEPVLQAALKARGWLA